MQTDDDSDISVHLIDAKVSLVNYPEVFTVAQFEIEIIYCIVTNMDQIPVLDQTYIVYTPSIAFGADFFTLTPLCGYTLDYLIQVKDVATGQYSPLPSWLSNVSDLDFSVQTDDPSNVSTYNISIIGSVPLNFMNPTYEEELIIVLTVNNDC